MVSILITNPHFALYGGAERQISELANYLTNKNHTVTIATTSACQEFKSSLKEARIYEAGTEENLVNFITKFSWKFQILNPHNHPMELLNPYPYKLKTIWQCNEPPGYVLEGKDINPQERGYVQATCNKAMVISDYDFARFRKVYGFDPVVNYPGIRYNFFSDDVKVRNTLNMKDNFVMTQVGYFTWTKNQTKTVEIFAEVKKDIPEAKLVLIGYNAWATQYPYVQSVHAKIAELGLEDDVFISDYLTGDDNIRNIYKQSDVCVNPVLDQGGYASVFEAISAGVPTIVSDNFVASSIVCNKNLGWVSSLTTEEFVNKIKFIYDKRPVSNHTWIRDNLTWENFGKKYEEVIEGL